jgi:hypothetical protein
VQTWSLDDKEVLANAVHIAIVISPVAALCFDTEG